MPASKGPLKHGVLHDLVRGTLEEWLPGYTDVYPDDGAQRKIEIYDDGWWEIHHCQTDDLEYRFKIKLTFIIDDEQGMR